MACAFLALGCPVLAFGQATVGAGAQPGKIFIHSGGRERFYYLYVPKSVDHGYPDVVSQVNRDAWTFLAPIELAEAPVFQSYP